MIREARIRYVKELASGSTVYGMIVDELDVNYMLDAFKSMGVEVISVETRERDMHTWMPDEWGWERRSV